MIRKKSSVWEGPLQWSTGVMRPFRFLSFWWYATAPWQRVGERTGFAHQIAWWQEGFKAGAGTQHLWDHSWVQDPIRWQSFVLLCNIAAFSFQVGWHVHIRDTSKLALQAFLPSFLPSSFFSSLFSSLSSFSFSLSSLFPWVRQNWLIKQGTCCPAVCWVGLWHDREARHHSALRELQDICGGVWRGS